MGTKSSKDFLVFTNCIANKDMIKMSYWLCRLAGIQKYS